MVSVAQLHMKKNVMHTYKGEKMSERLNKANELHKKGYNCAQAVVCAYCDIFGIEEKTAFLLAEGFGAGMGSMQGTCGAISGLVMLLGLKNSSGTVENLTKASTYKLTKEAVESFKNKNGSTICAEIKGLNGQPVLRSCDGCIADACAIFEQYLNIETTNKQ